MRIRPLVIAAAITVVAVLGGCRGASSTHSITPQEKASASALASIPGADARQILISKGVPINGTSAAQLAFAKSMLTKANREAFAKQLGIPKGPTRDAFEATLFTDAKADHVVTSHAGRVHFMDIDLPNAYQVAVS